MQSTMLSRILRVAQDAVARRNTIADEEGTESGFTLIELMVVLLIMAILLAIAIPTFLGVKGGAQDRAAQSNLTNGLLSAKALYSSQGVYPSAANFVITMATQEPELTFTATTVTGVPSSQVSFDLTNGTGNQIVLVDYSPNGGGTCWALSDNNGDAVAVAMGGAPLGDEYGEFKAPAAGCNAVAMDTTLAHAPPPGFWNNNYPTTPTVP